MDWPEGDAMITYTEKGMGLHRAINRAGHVLKEENGVWISSDDAAVQSIIDGYTLDHAKAYRAEEVSAHAKTLRDKVIRAVSAGEMASWPIKLAEARAFAQGASAEQCPMLSSEAASRGVTLSELVSKVSENATTFAGLESMIAGVDGKHRDAIKACSSFDEVAAYDYLNGWPEV